MGRQSLGMGNLYPPQDYMIAACEAMGIITVSDAHDFMRIKDKLVLLILAWANIL